MDYALYNLDAQPPHLKIFNIITTSFSSSIAHSNMNRFQMDDTNFLEMDEELLEMCGSFSTSRDVVSPFDLVGQWNLISTEEDLDLLLQLGQQSESAADDPISAASPEQPTLTTCNSDDHHTSPVPSSGQSSSDSEQGEEIISGGRESEVDERGEQLEDLEGEREMLRVTYEGEYDLPAPDDERTDSQLSDIRQVGVFVQTLPCVAICSLGPEDLKCPICGSEYGKDRGSTTSVPASQSDQVFPGQDWREFPVRLPCGHVFGHWCIATWLRGCQPPSCPVCRFSLQLAR